METLVRQKRIKRQRTSVVVMDGATAEKDSMSESSEDEGDIVKNGGLPRKVKGKVSLNAENDEEGDEDGESEDSEEEGEEEGGIVRVVGAAAAGTKVVKYTKQKWWLTRDDKHYFMQNHAKVCTRGDSLLLLLLLLLSSSSLWIHLLPGIGA